MAILTDLRAQLQSALGDVYTLQRELGGGGMSRVFVSNDAQELRDEWRSVDEEYRRFASSMVLRSVVLSPRTAAPGGNEGKARRHTDAR